MINVKELVEDFIAEGFDKLTAMEEARKIFNKKNKTKRKSLKTYNAEKNRPVREDIYSHAVRTR